MSDAVIRLIKRIEELAVEFHGERDARVKAFWELKAAEQANKTLQDSLIKSTNERDEARAEIVKIREHLKVYFAHGSTAEQARSSATYLSDFAQNDFVWKA